MSAPAFVRIRRNAAYNAAGRLASMAVWVALTPLALTRLGAERFGFWALLLLIGSTLTLLDLGLGAAVTTHAARLRHGGDPRAIRGIVRQALRAYLVLAALVAVAALAVMPFVLPLFHVPAAWANEARLAYLLAIASFLLVSLANVFQGGLVGLERLDLVAGAGLAASVVLLATAWGALHTATPLAALVAAQLLTNVLLAAGLAALLAVASRGHAAPGAPAGGAPGVRVLLRFGLLMQVGALAGVAHLQVDKALLGHMVGLASVGAYELAFRVSSGVAMLPTLALAAFIPAAALHDARTEGRARAALHARAMAPYLSITLPLVIAPCVLARPLFQAWLGAPRPDAELGLRLLLPAAGLTLLTGVATSIARAAGQPKLEAIYGVLALVLHVPLSILGIVRLGWAGAPLGGLVAVALATVWFLLAVQRGFGMRASFDALHGIGRFGLPALAGAAGALLAMHALPAGTGRGPALAQLAAGGMAFVTADGLALLVFSPASRRVLAHAVGRSATR